MMPLTVSVVIISGKRFLDIIILLRVHSDLSTILIETEAEEVVIEVGLIGNQILPTSLAFLFNQASKVTGSAPIFKIWGSSMQLGEPPNSMASARCPGTVFGEPTIVPCLWPKTS